MNDIEKVYSTKDIAEMVGIKDVTVRKYAQLLEQYGYHIGKDSKGHRMFFERDALVFNQFKTMRDQSGMSVEMVAEILVSKHTKASIHDISASDMKDNSATQTGLTQYDDRYIEVIEKLNQIDDILKENQELKRELQKVNKRLDRQEDRQQERDEQMNTFFNEWRESQKQLAAASEEKRGFLQKLKDLF